MIAEAHAAAQHVADAVSGIELERLLSLFNLMLLPIWRRLSGINERLATVTEWNQGHDKLDNARFRGLERELNDTNAMLNRLVDGAPISGAGVRPAAEKKG